MPKVTQFALNLVATGTHNALKHDENVFLNRLLNGTYEIKTGKKIEFTTGYMVACENKIIANQVPYLGVWFDDIELSYRVKSLKTALVIAINFNQTCIYDLKLDREIYTHDFIDVSNFTSYQLNLVRNFEKFICIRSNRAFFENGFSLDTAVKVLQDKGVIK